MKKLFLVSIMLITIIAVSCKSPKNKAIEAVDKTLKYFNKMQGGENKLSTAYSIPMIKYSYYLASNWKSEATEIENAIIVKVYCEVSNGLGIKSNEVMSFTVSPKDYTIVKTNGFLAVDDIPVYEDDDLKKIEIWERERKKIIIEKTEWRSVYGVAEGFTTVANNSNLLISNLKFIIDFYDKSGNICSTEETLALTDQPLIRGGRKRINWLTNYSDCASTCRVSLKFPCD